MPQKKQSEPETKPKSKVGAKKPVQKEPVQKEPVKSVAPPPPVETKKEEVVVDVEETTAMNPSDSTIKEFAEFQARLSTIRTSLSNLLQDFKTLQKKTERELKNAQKVGSKRKRKTGARGLRSILEKAMLDIMYETPSNNNIQEVVISENTITQGVPPKLIMRQSADNNRKMKVLEIFQLILL